MARRHSVYNQEQVGCGSRLMVWTGWLVILAIAYLAGAYAIGPYMQHYLLGSKPDVTTAMPPAVPTTSQTSSAPAASGATQPNAASTVTTPGIIINSAPNNNPAPQPQVSVPVAPKPIIHPRPTVQSSGTLQHAAPISGQNTRSAAVPPPVQKHHHRRERSRPSAPPAQPNLQQPETPQSPLNF